MEPAMQEGANNDARCKLAEVQTVKDYITGRIKTFDNFVSK